MYDFDTAGFIQTVVMPEVEDTRFVKPYRELVSNFSEETENEGGPSIVKQLITSSTSTARNFTKSDVDPQSGTFAGAVARWDYTYQEAAATVHNIDINQARNKGVLGIENLLTQSVGMAADGLWSLIYDNVYAQIKADLLNSGTFSDAALNRSTYPTLALYNDVTDATITVSDLRTCQFQTTFNKNGVDPSQYVFLMEPTVYHQVQPQIALLNTWNQTNTGAPVKGGYAPIAEFQGSKVAIAQGMTVGDVFFIRPQDVKIRKHMEFTTEVKQTGAFTTKIILRVGINAYVENVGKQGMLTNKD